MLHNRLEPYIYGEIHRKIHLQDTLGDILERPL
jgi:hypothetical protein